MAHQEQCIGLETSTTLNTGVLFKLPFWTNLIEENDTRFEMEAMELLDCLLAPLSSGKGCWDYDQDKMEEADARWSSNDLQWLQIPLIKYLNLFRLKKVEEIINPCESRANLIKMYVLAKIVIITNRKNGTNI